jgi:hypothetical protein
VRELPLLVPPRLAEAFGYPGGAACVGFCWHPAGDEVEYDDGRLAGTGEGRAYLRYTRHRAIAPHLAPYELGSSDAPARHRLALDRRARTLYVATDREARAHLGAQWPPLEVRPASSWTAEQWAAVDEARLRMAGRGARTQEELRAEVAARMAAQARVEADLVAWLDGQVAR